MSVLSSVDLEWLKQLIASHGVQRVWAGLLARHVAKSGSKFTYILENPLFDDYEDFEDDLLAGLSIGEIGVLYEFSVASADAKARKNNGQFYTPDDIAQLLVREAMAFPEGVWLDPCSGIGNLSWHLVAAQTNQEHFLLNNIILSDRDQLALEIARVLFTISFQQGTSDLYDQIENRFIRLDFLSIADNGSETLFGRGRLDDIPEHDYVIVNPPYLGLKQEDSRFETAKAKDLYAYFLENIIKTSKGFVSITPQSFTNAKKFESLRNLMLENYSALKIYAFDNIPGNVFFGFKFGSENSNSANSIRVAITIANRFSKEKETTSLLRWRTEERDQLIREIPNFLTNTELTSDFFPKVSKVFEGLYSEISSKPRLESILATRTTDHVLYIPGAPRYFISALKKPVTRASIKRVYFESEESLNMAYLVLNSSLTYWWWRVRDGGMTLSLETIKTVPLPEFSTSTDLIKALEDSEQVNKVYKMNAGAQQENVKHPLELIAQLNDLVMPAYASKLIRTHLNSELYQLAREK